MNKRLQAAQERHNKWLLKRGLKIGKPKVTGAGVGMPDLTYEKRGTPTSDKIDGQGAARPEQRYTGTELLGIGTMHKSNSVPVRKDSKAAIEIAQMRRN